MAVETGTAEQFETVSLEGHAKVALVRLNRPQALNAIDVQMRNDLVAALERVRHHGGYRAMVLCGAGRGFNAGADVRTMGQEGMATAAEVRTRVQLYADMVLGLTRLEMPVVGAIHGVAAGIGFSLALACDMVVAGRSTRFIQAFAQLALVPDGGSSWFLARLLGPQRAKELIFSMRPVEAEEGLRLGFVNRVVEDAEVEAEGLALASQLAEGPTLAYAAAKRLVNQGLVTDLETALEAEAALQGVCFATADAREGVSAFLEKRRPSFEGR